MIGVAVAFYLGFKNNASYDRVWEARKIWGAIVNASRSWAFTCRDFISGHWADDRPTSQALDEVHKTLVLRHVAWMDALRYQLRKVKTWEHDDEHHNSTRAFFGAPEYVEELADTLQRSLPPAEVEQVLAQINPAAHLLSNQSRDLNQLFERGWIDSFRHMELQKLLIELMTQQGKAERIKNFPFPRQYATVNSYFAWLLVGLIPFGMTLEFARLGPHMVWLSIPFSTIIGWVFLTADQIGDWSENPFEGLPNDVPISAMSRGIERDIKQIVGISELPPSRQAKNGTILM